MKLKILRQEQLLTLHINIGNIAPHLHDNLEEIYFIQMVMDSINIMGSKRPSGALVPVEGAQKPLVRNEVRSIAQKYNVIKTWNLGTELAALPQITLHNSKRSPDDEEEDEAGAISQDYLEKVQALQPKMEKVYNKEFESLFEYVQMARDPRIFGTVRGVLLRASYDKDGFKKEMLKAVIKLRARVHAISQQPGT